MDTFFEVEVEMEKDVCRDLVCTSPKDEEGFAFNLTLFRTVFILFRDKLAEPVNKCKGKI